MDMSKQLNADQIGASNPAIVRYDAGCSMCVMLAKFAQKRLEGANFMIFEPAGGASAVTNLSVEIPSENRVVMGEEAWLWLLEMHPVLEELNWIARKIGVTRQVGHGLMRAGDLMRRFCFRCR